MPAHSPFTALCQATARPARWGRADLHLHSTASDGTYTPTQLVELARLAGLSALALTDHDTLQGLSEARRAASGAGPEVIAGVEISAEYGGRELHLLGYFVNPDNTGLQSSLEYLRRGRVERFRAMVDRLRALGIRLHDPERFLSATPATVGRRHLAELLIESGAVSTIREAFARYLGDRSSAVVAKQRLPVAEAIACVRTAGGVASWAHPSYDCNAQTLQELHGFGLHAVEVDFPGANASRSKELRTFAMALRLAVTGGSDCHGPEPAGRGPGYCSVAQHELEALRQLATP